MRLQVNENIGCKYPVTIQTDNHSYAPRGMSIAIFLASNRHAQRMGPGTKKFFPRNGLTVNPDPNEGEARAWPK